MAELDLASPARGARGGRSPPRQGALRPAARIVALTRGGGTAQRSQDVAKALEQAPVPMSPMAAARTTDVCSRAMMQPVPIAKILCVTDLAAEDGRPRSLCAAERSDGTFCVLLDGEWLTGAPGNQAGSRIASTVSSPCDWRCDCRHITRKRDRDSSIARDRFVKVEDRPRDAGPGGEVGRVHVFGDGGFAGGEKLFRGRFVGGVTLVVLVIERGQDR